MRRIAVTYNLKPTTAPKDAREDAYSEFDSERTVEAIVGALQTLGDEVIPVEASGELLAWFQNHPVDFVFNIAEGHEGAYRESLVPAILELLKIPYTGSGVLSLALAQDKARAKQIFQAQDLTTPAFQLFAEPTEALNPSLRFPLIVKPNREGSSKGIWASSVVVSPKELSEQVHRVWQRYHQPVLVEEFIEGKELTVGLLGNHAPQIFPVLEIDFGSCKPSGETFYSWKMKEFQGNQALHLTPKFHCPARLDETTTRQIQAMAVGAYEALSCQDFCRVDLRLGKDGVAYLLEANPLPGLDPDESNFPLMAREAGIDYVTLIARILDAAVSRTAVHSSLCTIENGHRSSDRVLWPAKGGR